MFIDLCEFLVDELDESAGIAPDGRKTNHIHLLITSVRLVMTHEKDNAYYVQCENYGMKCKSKEDAEKAARKLVDKIEEYYQNDFLGRAAAHAALGGDQVRKALRDFNA